jgi:predicted metal-dependent hydrolase
MHRTIAYGQESVSFEVCFSDRKTLDIAVQPDQQVIVTAPTNAPLETVDRRVREKVRWILQQQQFFSQFNPRTPPRKYISGETHLYLGRQYRLKVQPAPTPSVKLVGRYIHIATPTPQDSETVKELLDNWYGDRARIQFQEHLDQNFPRFAALGFEKPPLIIRPLSKRWGSLTAAHNLILNRDLIRAPRACIDYVITHELCHLKHPNHSQQFYNFLEIMLPNWKKFKLQLEQKLV